MVLFLALLAQDRGDPPFLAVLGIASVGVCLLFWGLHLLTRQPKQAADNVWDIGFDEEITTDRPVFHASLHDLPTVIIGNQPQNDYAARLMPVDMLDELLDTLPVTEAQNQRPSGFHFSIGVSNGKDVFHKLDHFRLAGKSGSGKTWSLARVLVQLLEQGVQIYYVNPKYMPVDEDGVNLDPIIERCQKVAIGVDGKDGLLLLEEARTLMFDRIRQAREQKIANFPPVVVIVDELSALESAWKRLEEEKTHGYKSARKRGTNAIDLLLRWGRQPRVFYGTTSQDGQVQNGPTNSGTAVNFGVSACHPSLDGQSIRNILGDADIKNLAVSSPYQWWVISVNPTGQDHVVQVSAPKLTNEYIRKTLASVPVVPEDVRNIAVQDSRMNRPLVRDMAEKLIESALAIPQQRPEQPGTPEQGDQDGTELAEQPLRWTDEHLKVYGLITQNPNISQRDVARKLWGKCEGRWNGRAGQLMAQVKKLKKEE